MCAAGVRCVHISVVVALVWGPYWQDLVSDLGHRNCCCFCHGLSLHAIEIQDPSPGSRAAWPLAP